MARESSDLTVRILRLLEKDPRQPVKELAEKPEVNRTFLVGYMKALGNQVGDGTFGLLVSDKVRCVEPISATEVSEEAFILRIDVAQRMKVEAGGIE
jgi:DNA-binding Lrp family transcriptional regulator